MVLITATHTLVEKMRLFPCYVSGKSICYHFTHFVKRNCLVATGNVVPIALQLDVAMLMAGIDHVPFSVEIPFQGSCFIQLFLVPMEILIALATLLVVMPHSLEGSKWEIHLQKYFV